MRTGTHVVAAMMAVFLTIRLAPAAAMAAAAAPNQTDETDVLFDSSRLLEVVVQMDPADWERMRYEHHNLFYRSSRSRTEARESPYSYYKASVTIDGERIDNVGIRKKGFLGSANSQRPSIKLHFDKFKRKKRFKGLEMMTLNNNDTDVDQLSQYLAYRVFRKAGLAAPRCSLARVTVNGEYLGVFSHVESVRKRFLKRNYTDGRGTLYEGQISDFWRGLVNSFQRKTNKKRADRSDLDRVVQAMESDDAEFIAAIQQVVDLDEFYRYWATECLVGFWDSYSGNRNNYFIYHDPSTDRFRFIPWGTDGAMIEGSGRSTDGATPKSVQIRGLLPYRLYRLPEGRKQFRATMRELLNTAWNEDELLAEVDRLQALIAPHIHFRREVFNAATTRLRAFIKNRRRELMAELSDDAPEWTPPSPSAGRRARGRRGGPPTVRCHFDAVWTSKGAGAENFRQPPPIKDRPSPGQASLEFKSFYPDQKLASVRVFASPSTSGVRDGFPVLDVCWTYESMPEEFTARFVIDPKFFRPKTEATIDGYAVFAFLLERSGDKPWKRSSWIRGRLQLDSAGTSEGVPVKGRLDLEILGPPRQRDD